MARQWVNPIGGAAVNEDGEEEYILPIGGAALQEDQPVAVGYVPYPRYPMTGGMQSMGGGM